jgi:hypothetical protein
VFTRFPAGNGGTIELIYMQVCNFYFASLLMFLQHFW